MAGCRHCSVNLQSHWWVEMWYLDTVYSQLKYPNKALIGVVYES